MKGSLYSCCICSVDWVRSRALTDADLRLLMTEFLPASLSLLWVVCTWRIFGRLCWPRICFCGSWLPYSAARLETFFLAAISLCYLSRPALWSLIKIPTRLLLPHLSTYLAFLSYSNWSISASVFPSLLNASIQSGSLSTSLKNNMVMLTKGSAVIKLHLRLFEGFRDARASGFRSEWVVLFPWSQSQGESLMCFRSHRVWCLPLLIKVFVCELACRDMESCEALAQTVHIDIKFLLCFNLQVFVLPMSSLMLVLP